MLTEGKLSLPVSHDKMVNYLFASYPQLQRLRRNVKLIPVTINYERFLSEKDINLTGSVYEILRQMSKLPPQTLGNIFVNYASPVDLHTYVA